MADDQPSDTLSGRSARSTAVLWVILEANRWVVAAGVLFSAFLALLVVGILHPNAIDIITTDDPVDTLFQALATATITGVTLVLTLNQLVLSQELGAVGDQRERMEGAMDFRTDVEEIMDAPVSPADPSAFLRAFVDLISEQAQVFRDVLDADEGDLPEYADELVDSIEGNASQVSDQLEGESFGEFAVVSAALNFNYSWKLYAARRIKKENEDVLNDEAMAALDDLIQSLRLFGPAREHFKTLYFQSDLIDLSRAILATAMPALFVSIAMIIYFDPSALVGSLAGVSLEVWTISLASSVALTPFAILLSFVVRIATITKRTLSIGPFILRKTDRDEDLDWD